MPQAVADTHALIWYVMADRRLSPRAKSAIDDAAAAGDTILVSGITLVEMVYLVDKGRIDPAAYDVVLEALERPRAVLVEAPVDRVIAQAMLDANPPDPAVWEEIGRIIEDECERIDPRDW